ncbi:MAG: hypothetical protein FWD88_06410, partial [Treponema sp.]|nr:hypothetical protein [Treponema sp.]
MPLKSIAIGLFMCAVAVSGLYAANVSFLVMETGVPRDGASSRYSIMWENGLLEVFFESGHIVSNAPRMSLTDTVISEGFPSEAARDHADARNGGMDYFLIAIIEHPSRDVSLRLFTTTSQKMIAERAYPGSSTRTVREENENIRTAVREMAAFVR